MKMTWMVRAAAAALLAGTGALAQEAAGRTVTIDGQDFAGQRTVTRAPGERSVAAEVTRKADGATASRERQWARTADGVAASGERTGFDGRTRSADYARTRSGTGSTETGSLTRRDGTRFELSGEGGRTEDGRVRTRTISDAQGRVLRMRTDRLSRADGMVTRERQVSRAGRRGR